MNGLTFKLNQTKIWMPFIIILIGLAARLYQLDAKSLWFDEIVRVELAEMSWYDGFIGLLNQGMQLTPFFHGIIKLWLLVGDTDWLLRVPAAWIGVLTIPLVFKVGQYYFGNSVGLLAAFVFSINPYQVWYGQEAALYNVLTFAALGSMLAFGTMLRSGGKHGWKAMIIFNVLGFPAHYFMFLISAVQFLYIVVTLRRTRRVLRYWFVAQVIPVLVLIPWWLFIIYQNHLAVGIGWVPQPRWFDPLLTVWDFSFAYSGQQPSPIIVVSLIVLALGLVIGVWQSWRLSRWGGLMTLWLVFPPVITYVMSFRYISFYVDRYLLIISPVVTFFTVYGLLSLPLKWLRWGMIVVFIGGTLWGLESIYFDPVHYNKDDWRTLAQNVDAQAQPGDIVVACHSGYRLAFEYYNPHQALSPDDVVALVDIDQLTNVSDYRTAWIINLHYRPPIHTLAADLSPVLNPTLLSPAAARWETENFRSNLTVPGLSAYRYDVSDMSLLSEVARWHCQSFYEARRQVYSQ